ncbi:hypothetical protein GCM10008939_18960 [Deinococcus aquiradiocola]|uniref:DUF1802 family protein n=1 Tax=Deinococcus aquiradiocola TaxID=393059 RepID=A0A917UQ67_9DEIO|nr:hypothetical protein GCM10008939_18960 [Deinococcus aquiradiocola]
MAVVVRKGGIMETHAGFEVEHRRFLLYPTFLHQNPVEVRGEFRGLLRADPAPGVLVLPALAEVVAVYRVESLERAVQLEPFQVLTAEAIERRFAYRNRPWVHAVLVRVSPLVPPLVLEETPEMLGCVSWVPLPGGVLSGVGGQVRPEGELLALREELDGLLR